MCDYFSKIIEKENLEQRNVNYTPNEFINLKSRSADSISWIALVS